MKRIAPFLAPSVVGDLLCGRDIVSKQRCALVLRSHVEKGELDRALDAVIDDIAQRAVRRAGAGVIGKGGRINFKSSHASALVPALADLSIAALIQLKAVRLLGRLKSVFSKS